MPDRELGLSPELTPALLRYRWPGNLRQLHNALQTACAMLDDVDTHIAWAHLPDDLARDLSAAEVPAPRKEINLADDLRAQSERTVKQTVQACGGNLSEAARRLGISRNALYRKLREMGGR